MRDGIAEAKAERRRELRRRLAAMTEEEDATSGAAIARAVLASSLYREAASVFVYVSTGKEPDTWAILRQALRDGKAVYVPKCREKPRMDAVRIRSLDELRPGRYGIPEPEDGETGASFGLAVVPCLGAAPDGTRLGHGGGYYDAFLRAHPARTLCLCHAVLLCESLPSGPLDVRVDAVAAGGGIRFAADYSTKFSILSTSI